jgi:hypothetical protein
MLIYPLFYSSSCRLNLAAGLQLHGTRKDHNGLIRRHLSKHLLTWICLVYGARSAVHESWIIVDAIESRATINIIGVGSRIDEGSCIARAVSHRDVAAKHALHGCITSSRAAVLLEAAASSHIPRHRLLSCVLALLLHRGDACFSAEQAHLSNLLAPTRVCHTIGSLHVRFSTSSLSAADMSLGDSLRDFRVHFAAQRRMQPF